MNVRSWKNGQVLNRIYRIDKIYMSILKNPVNPVYAYLSSNGAGQRVGL